MRKRVLGFGFLAFAQLGAFFLLATTRANAQTETILHSFGSQPGDGANPHGGLLYNKGNLYGTTDFDAPSGNLGIVFEISAEDSTRYCITSAAGPATEPHRATSAVWPSG